MHSQILGDFWSSDLWQIGDFMDDLMEGFAELYRVAWLVGLLVGLPTCWFVIWVGWDSDPAPAHTVDSRWLTIYLWRKISHTYRKCVRYPALIGLSIHAWTDYLDVYRLGLSDIHVHEQSDNLQYKITYILYIYLYNSSISSTLRAHNCRRCLGQVGGEWWADLWRMCQEDHLSHQGVKLSEMSKLRIIRIPDASSPEDLGRSKNRYQVLRLWLYTLYNGYLHLAAFVVISCAFGRNGLTGCITIVASIQKWCQHRLWIQHFTLYTLELFITSHQTSEWPYLYFSNHTYDLWLIIINGVFLVHI